MNFWKKTKKILVSLIAMVTLSAGVGLGTTALLVNPVAADTTQTDAPTKIPAPLKLNVKGAIGIDANSGQILFQQNADQALPVASLTKILTIYLVMQAIHDGKLSWDQKLVPDKTCVAISQNTKFSNVPLKANTGYTVRSLYQATIIYSANAAAMVLAKAVGGSQKNFVDMMRKQVAQFGIKDAKIYTCNGLDNGDLQADAYPGAPNNAQNKFSAKDMALISQKLIMQYPEVLNTSKIKEMNFNNGTSETKMENWNKMLPGSSNSYEKLPVDGLKTGTSDSAGACFVGTLSKEGHRLITVILGAQHKNENDNSRFVQTQKMMSYIYHTYNYTTIKADHKFNNTNLPVFHGKENEVATKTAHNQGLWLKKNLTPNDVTAKVKVDKSKTKDDSLKAPIKENEDIGTLTLAINGQKLQTIDGNGEVQIKAEAVNAVKKANIFEIMWHKVKSWF